MKIVTTLAFLLFLYFQAWSQSSLKQVAHEYIDQLSLMLYNMKDSIAIWAEPSFMEYKTSHLLKERLSAAGFQIQEGIGGIETMFIASYGEKGPTIAILGEYDADVFNNGQVGHASGHHWLGVGSAGAALSLQQLVASGSLEARILYVGSTAEGGFGGRAHLAGRQYFQGVDLAIFWHPSPVTWASTSPWDALIDLEVKFVGEKEKAVEVPTKPSSLWHEVLDITSTLEKLKMDIDSSTHLHYSLESSQASYNYTMDTVGLKIRIQASQQLQANRLYHIIRQQVEEKQNAGASIQFTTFRAIHAFLPNNPGMQMVATNMEALGEIPFTKEDDRQARKIQHAQGFSPSGLHTTLLPFQTFHHSNQLRTYASDIGDVSWWAPTLSFVTTCYPRQIPIGDPIAAELALQSFGEKGMLYAAKVICSSAIDYVQNEALQEAIKTEFERRIKGQSYMIFSPQEFPTADRNSKRSK